MTPSWAQINKNVPNRALEKSIDKIKVSSSLYWIWECCLSLYRAYCNLHIWLGKFGYIKPSGWVM